MLSIKMSVKMRFTIIWSGRAGFFFFFFTKRINSFVFRHCTCLIEFHSQSIPDKIAERFRGNDIAHYDRWRLLSIMRTNLLDSD